MVYLCTVYCIFTYQVLQSDLVWTHKWPFQGLSDLHFGNQKGHFEEAGTFAWFVWFSCLTRGRCTICPMYFILNHQAIQGRRRFCWCQCSFCSSKGKPPLFRCSGPGGDVLLRILDPKWEYIIPRHPVVPIEQVLKKPPSISWGERLFRGYIQTPDPHRSVRLEDFFRCLGNRPPTRRNKLFPLRWRLCFRGRNSLGLQKDFKMVEFNKIWHWLVGSKSCPRQDRTHWLKHVNIYVYVYITRIYMHVSHVKVSGTGRAGNPGNENSHGKKDSVDSFCITLQRESEHSSNWNDISSLF